MLNDRRLGRPPYTTCTSVQVVWVCAWTQTQQDTDYIRLLFSVAGLGCCLGLQVVGHDSAYALVKKLDRKL